MMAMDFDCGVFATSVKLFGSLGITIWMGKTIETYGAAFLQDSAVLGHQKERQRNC